ncbi:pyridoxamine 5'-phosphate oxidase family protein [Haloechinothrix halophila]|uniref:pyridoxamine 5'-phosphate oxidase family protein n=1 Tax=Haloechinothrix halophila TaxID=1069073 RepID=UPI0009FDB7C9|nr:pyridoxamine 5'-phosphate oxidase family protein [Haloechinothrix halophila]
MDLTPNPTDDVPPAHPPAPKHRRGKHDAGNQQGNVVPRNGAPQNGPVQNGAHHNGPHQNGHPTPQPPAHATAPQQQPPQPPEPTPKPSETWEAPPVVWRAVPPEPEDPAKDTDTHLPGSAGEHLLQLAYNTRTRAERFYQDQVCEALNDEMIDFIDRMEMAFIATADANGEADCSPRFGPPGFIQVLDRGHVAYPEYRGNGVMASLGNISENPHVGILLLDFVRDRIGLHINGRAMIVDHDAMRAEFDGIPEETERGRTPERWVLVEIDEAYIHCRKHIPRMIHADADQAWGTDDVKRKGGDYFGVRKARKEDRKEAQRETSPARELSSARRR